MKSTSWKACVSEPDRFAGHLRGAVVGGRIAVGHRERRIGLDQALARALVIGRVARDRDQLAHAQLPRNLAGVHQPHDVGLVGRERLRQRRLQSHKPGGMHHRVDLLGAAHLEQPREVADLAGAEARGEGRGHTQQVRRRRRHVIGERRVAGGLQSGHRDRRRESPRRR
jgi:hypothetical protein